MGDAKNAVQTNQSSAQPHLRRVLTLWDLIFYGIVLIQPIAPVPLFGVVQERSHGYIVDTILIAMFAMMITAFSYGRMAALYPSAGSAYTYVGRGLNLHLGFLVGWAMFLDYLLQPLINAVWVAETIHGWVHWIPAYALMAVFIGAITLHEFARHTYQRPGQQVAPRPDVCRHRGICAPGHPLPFPPRPLGWNFFLAALLRSENI